MRKLAAVVVLLCLASVAMAAGAPKVMAPKNGDRLGPSTDVIGKTDGKQFVIIITDVYVDGKYIKSVPGHRHWTDAMGNFKLRIATPRAPRAPKCDLKYKIRVFTARPDTGKGPETVVTCYAK